MHYLNQFKLLVILHENEQVDAAAVLDKVIDKTAVYDAVARNKKGVMAGEFKGSGEKLQEENLEKMPEQDRKYLMEYIYPRLRTETEKAITELYDMQARYPGVPYIYNFLATAHMLLGKDDVAFEIAQETVKRFPEYLFGRITLAHAYINRGELHHVPAVLKNKLNIYQHHPNGREIYHISEVKAFYHVVGIYCVETGQKAEALYCYEILRSFVPDDAITQNLADRIFLQETKSLRQAVGDRLSKLKKNRPGKPGSKPRNK